MEFKIGQTIYHEKLGEGEITKITERKENGVTYLPIVEVKFKNVTHAKVKEEKSSRGYTMYVTYQTPYYEFTTQSLESHLLPDDILD